MHNKKNVQLATAICDSGISVAMFTSYSQRQQRADCVLVVEIVPVLNKLTSLLMLLSHLT